MTTITLTALRSNLAKTIDRVVQDSNPVIVTRARSKPVVIMSLDDYESYEETAYLMRSPANAKNLIDSEQQIKEGKVVKYTVKEWRNKYGRAKNK